jgi:hypothetical protein
MLHNHDLHYFKIQNHIFTCKIRYPLYFDHFDQGIRMRIRSVYTDPGSEFLHPGSRVKRSRIPNPDPHQRIQLFLTQKNVSQLSDKIIWDVHPGYPRIPDPRVKKAPDPQHCFLRRCTSVKGKE